MDLLAGSSFEKDIGLILRGDLSGNLVIGKSFIGAGFGALYIDGKKSRGIVYHLKDLAVHGLFSFGYLF